MKKVRYILTFSVGILLLAAGIVMIKVIQDPEGMFRTFPYILLGIGSGMFGSGVGGFINQKVMEKNPEIEKRQRIEREDERNQMIQNAAKAKAYDRMIFVFGAYLLILTLVGADVAITLLFCAMYLFVVGVNIYYLNKMAKSM